MVSNIAMNELWFTALLTVFQSYLAEKDYNKRRCGMESHLVLERILSSVGWMDE